MPYLDSTNASASTGAKPARPAGAAQALILVFTTQLPIMGLLSLIPIIPLLARHFGEHPQSALLIPLLITAPSACIALLSPLAGYLADKLGRRRLLLIAVFFYGVCGFAPFFLTDLVSIVACRFLLGITEAVIMTVANTLFGDFFDPEPRRKWLAVQSAVGSLSGTILMLIGGLLGTIGWNGPFLLYLLAFPIFLGLLLWTWEPEHKTEAHESSTKTRFPATNMAIIAAVTLFCAVLYYVEVLQISQVLNAMGVESTSAIGVAGGIAGLGVPLGALIFARLSRRGIQLHLMVVFALFAIGLMGLGMAANIYLAVASAFIAQVGCGMLIPALMNWCLGGLIFEHRGKGVGIWTASFFIGQFVSPFVVGKISDLLGGLLPAVVALGAVALCALIVTALLINVVRARTFQAC